MFVSIKVSLFHLKIIIVAITNKPKTKKLSNLLYLSFTDDLSIKCIKMKEMPAKIRKPKPPINIVSIKNLFLIK